VKIEWKQELLLDFGDAMGCANHDPENVEKWVVEIENHNQTHGDVLWQECSLEDIQKKLLWERSTTALEK
jgi:hypothetical protein